MLQQQNPENTTCPICRQSIISSSNMHESMEPLRREMYFRYNRARDRYPTYIERSMVNDWVTESYFYGNDYSNDTSYSLRACGPSPVAARNFIANNPSSGNQSGGSSGGFGGGFGGGSSSGGGGAGGGW